jgi:transposase InsO family protein
LWTADITYVPTWQGFLYLAVVLDVFSRRIVGWAMAEHMLPNAVVSRSGRTCGFVESAVAEERPQDIDTSTARASTAWV